MDGSLALGNLWLDGLLLLDCLLLQLQQLLDMYRLGHDSLPCCFLWLSNCHADPCNVHRQGCDPR